LQQVREAATVMLLRQGPSNIEVLMLRRNLNLEFVGGAYVFPGGKVDKADRDPEVIGRSLNLGDLECSKALGISSGGVGYFVAAIRESFEESGIFIGSRSDGTVPTEEELSGAREDLLLKRSDFADVLAKEDLYMDLSQLVYFAHWITPEAQPKRYDTRFFVASAPLGQLGMHDDSETVSHLWIDPNEALSGAKRKSFEIVLPTRQNLMAIAKYKTVNEVLEAAAHSEKTVVVPKLTRGSGGLELLLPWEEGYDEAISVHLEPGESLQNP
jgi:8-oxo-dGTP pyrophosphatase MutT (NUDIX family)